MEIKVEKVTEFYLFKVLDGLQSSWVCLEIAGGSCYLVAPKIKKIKETAREHSYPCFRVSGVDTEAFSRALTYYGYEAI